MNANDIKARTRAFILDNFILGANARSFGDDASFIEHHIIDSTGFLELITHLEETYDFVVEDLEMVPENLDSLNAIAAYVASKKA